MEAVRRDHTTLFRLRGRVALVVVSLALAVGGCLRYDVEWQRRMMLTSEHGEEARQAIQTYEQTWLNKDVMQNPALQNEVATQQWTEHMGVQEPSRGGLVTTSATITAVSVIEYSPERLKSAACRTIKFDELTREGQFMRSGEFSQCGTYVFWKLDETWKLAGYFNDADRRYWDHAPQWLRDVMGELPDN